MRSRTSFPLLPCLRGPSEEGKEGGGRENGEWHACDMQRRAAIGWGDSPAILITTKSPVIVGHVWSAAHAVNAKCGGKLYDRTRQVSLCPSGCRCRRPRRGGGGGFVAVIVGAEFE